MRSSTVKLQFSGDRIPPRVLRAQILKIAVDLEKVAGDSSQVASRADVDVAELRRGRILDIGAGVDEVPDHCNPKVMEEPRVGEGPSRKRTVIREHRAIHRNP